MPDPKPINPTDFLESAFPAAAANDPRGSPEPSGQPDSLLQAFRDRFERDGFAFESGAAMKALVSESVAEWLCLAHAAAAVAPWDTNPGAERSNRRRYYSTGTYSPRAAANRRFARLPPFVTGEGKPFTTYLQPEGANRDQSAERRFTPLPDLLLEHAGFRELIGLYFRACPMSLFARTPDLLKWGAHLISLQPDDYQAAISSPNRIHFDGEYITFIVMLERVDVIKGGSLITRRRYADCHPDDVPEEGRLFECELADPLDVLVTDDRRVCHYVFPVFGRKNGKGRRTVLLIDFTPLAPHTSDQRLDEE